MHTQLGKMNNMYQEQQQLTIVNHAKKEKITLKTKDPQQALFDPALTFEWDIFADNVEWGLAADFYHLDYITKDEQGKVTHIPVSHKMWLGLKRKMAWTQAQTALPGF